MLSEWFSVLFLHLMIFLKSARHTNRFGIFSKSAGKSEITKKKEFKYMLFSLGADPCWVDFMAMLTEVCLSCSINNSWTNAQSDRTVYQSNVVNSEY